MNFIDEFLLGKLIIHEVTPEDATAVRLCDKHHPLLITFLKVKLRGVEKFEQVVVLHLHLFLHVVGCSPHAVQLRIRQ